MLWPGPGQTPELACCASAASNIDDLTNPKLLRRKSVRGAKRCSMCAAFF
jgi:hypothetical protein